MKLNGVFPILVSPFKADESIDVESLKTLVLFMRKLNVDGITVLGVLGEANRLTENERKNIISYGKTQISKEKLRCPSKINAQRKKTDFV